MQFNCKMGYSGNEQDYQLVKTSIGKLKCQKEVLRYLTNVLPNPTDIVTLDNAQNTVKSVKAQLANKNLIPYPYTDTTKTISGVTFTVNSDGSITANGTATAQAYFKLQQSFSLKKGQYFFSGCPKGGAGSTYSLYLSTADYKFYKADLGNGISINAEDDKTVSIVINIAKDTTVENLVFKPQLELGTTATAYTPYISDFSTVNVTRYGKNLFNQALLTDWGLVLTDGKYVGSSSYFNGKTLASNFQNNTQYTISLKGYNTNSTEASILISVNYTDGTSATIIRLTAKSETEYKFTSAVGKTVSSFKGTYYNADTVNISYIQIEEGTTATPYEPYQGQTYTPTASGEVSGITVLTPTTNIINDKGLLFTKVIGDDFNYIN